MNEKAAVSGVALIDRVIEKVKEEGFGCLDRSTIKRPKPVPPGVLAGLRFPNGELLSPSLKRFLAFDGSWLSKHGWYADPTAPRFTPQSLSDFAAREYDAVWREAFAPFEAIIRGHLFLLPLGSDSRRALYVGKPDSTGEHPVIVTDNDDGPYVGLMYPGFDVYMGHLSGVLTLKFPNYESLQTHRDYKARLAEHRELNFGGHRGLDFSDVYADASTSVDAEAAPEDETATPPPAAVAAKATTAAKKAVATKTAAKKAPAKKK